MGWAVSLLNAMRLRGLTYPTAPTGVSRLPLKSTNLVFFKALIKNNNLLEKSLFIEGNYVFVKLVEFEYILKILVERNGTD